MTSESSQVSAFRLEPNVDVQSVPLSARLTRLFDLPYDAWRCTAVLKGMPNLSTIAASLYELPVGYEELQAQNSRADSAAQEALYRGEDDRAEQFLLSGFLQMDRDEYWWFRVRGGSLFKIVTSPGLLDEDDYEPNSLYWIGGSFRAKDSFDGTSVEFDAEISETVDTSENLVPIYANHSQAQNFIRSRAIFDLVAHLEQHASAKVEDWRWLTMALRIVHNPEDFDQMTWAVREDVCTGVQNLLRGYEPEACEPYDADKDRAEWMALLGPIPGSGQESSTDSQYADDAESHGSPVLPGPRFFKTTRDAELHAADVMVALGFSSVRVTPIGPDAGIDVHSQEAVAQVKMEGVPTGRPALQRLAGAAMSSGRSTLFFSLAGYTQQALEWAEQVDMACFEFSYDGEIEPKTRLAHLLLREGRQALPT